MNGYLQSIPLPPSAWKLTATIRENEELDRDYLDVLDRAFVGGQRQLWVGE